MIPKDVCIIIKRYYDDYNSCEFVDMYDISHKITLTSTGCLLNRKIYIVGYDLSGMGKIIVYDIEKKKFETNSFINYSYIKMEIHNKKIYILSSIGIISCDLDLNNLCHIKYNNHDNTIRDFTICNNYFYYMYCNRNNIYVFDRKKENIFCKTNNNLEDFCIYDDYLYKTISSQNSINIERINIKNGKTKIILLTDLYNTEYEIFLCKKLIINKFNIYLLMREDILCCFNLFGKLNYKINIHEVLKEHSFGFVSSPNDIIIDAQYIYILIRGIIFELRQY